MSHSNGHDTAAKNETPFTGMISPKFDPAAVAAFWQSSSARLMRSTEVFIRGMVGVARLEAELGQQLLQRGVVGHKTPSSSAAEEQAGAQAGQATQEFEKIIAGLRKIGEESRNTCREATFALFGAPGSAPSHADLQSKPAETLAREVVARGRAALNTVTTRAAE